MSISKDNPYIESTVDVFEPRWFGRKVRLWIEQPYLLHPEFSKDVEYAVAETKRLLKFNYSSMELIKELMKIPKLTALQLLEQGSKNTQVGTMIYLVPFDEETRESVR